MEVRTFLAFGDGIFREWYTNSLTMDATLNPRFFVTYRSENDIIAQNK